MAKNSDLHTHSYYSDGYLSPAEVIRRAKAKGVRHFALTDHNSIEGVAETVKEGRKIGVNVIPAIEIRAKEDEVLGYFIDYKNNQFRKEIKKLQDNVTERVKKIVLRINKDGIKIKFSDLVNKYKPNKDNLMEIHAIRHLIDLGYGESSRKGIGGLWAKYVKVIPYKEISVIDSIKLIKKFGGVPVLAHPWCEASAKKLLEDKEFRKLIRAGLEGIEIDNGDRDERRDSEIISRIKHLAKKYGLIITSGSDFHRGEKSREWRYHNLGMCNCDDKVVEELRKLAKIK